MKLTTEQVIKMLKEPAGHEFIGKEKEFEEHIILHLDIILDCLGLPSAKIVDRQKRIDFDDFSIQPDIIIRHTDDSITVLEVKCCNHKHPATATTHQTNAIGQALLYKTALETYTGQDIRVIIVDQKIHYRSYVAFRKYCLPITLVEFQNDRVFIPYKNFG